MQNHEANDPFRLESLVFPAVVISGLCLLSMAGFSGRSRDKAIARSGNRSEISGVEPGFGETLEVMHIDHTKDDTYDHPSRSLVVTVLEHLIYHRTHRGRAGEIGLTEAENDGSIRLLSWKAKETEKKKKWYRAP